MTYRNLSNIFKTILAVAFLAIVPGMGMAQTNNFSDIKPGSILFFNRYTSNPINPLLGDTQINITNLNQNKAVALHFYMIDGSSCSVADSGTSLAPSQTLTYLMSDFDPGTFGYMIVVAENAGTDTIPGTGLPTQHNWLAGTAMVREFDGRQAILSAISIAKVSAGDIAPDPDGQYRLKFNGAIYDKLPQTLAIPSFDSPVSTTTFLYVYAPSTNIYVGDATAASIFALVFNDASGSPLSGSFSLTCYRQDSLANYFRGGGVTRQVPNSGRTGWVRLHSANAPILGSVISRNSMFQGGYNLTAIALFGNHEIVVPNF